MRSILDHCTDAEPQHFAAGTELLSEGKASGRLFILIDGRIEVLRGGTQIALVDEPGSVFGEMSILLDVPHTATVSATRRRAPTCARTPKSSSARIRRSASTWPACLPRASMPRSAYLVDLKRQFEGQPQPSRHGR